mmetsp:Transcript_6186/g.6459  ORF Transcript_6186/g.6459 Transcript_6186/m.6459 type:complete len:575 (+) Transcript_6186:102-1826(+)
MLSHSFLKRFYSSSKVSLARILATDKVDPLCINIFKTRGHEVDLLPTMNENELLKVIGEYDGLVVRSATKVTPKILRAAKKMRIVGRAGVGVDNIDVNEATKCGIMVMNTPDGNTVSTAQLAISLLCNMARKIPTANMSVKEGKWIPKNFQGYELQGKTIGIVGCGRIGQVVGKLSRTLGMNVVGYDPISDEETLAELGIKKLSLENVLKTSDFITVHTPLTAETKNLLNDTTLALCKKGVGIINCARGGIIDEDALLRGLNSGHISTAALDVYTTEPPKENLTELLRHPNLVCTPHLGASTEEAQVNVAKDIAQQICDLFDQKEFVGIVNVPYISLSTLPQMKPFMSLAETLGSIVSQISEKQVKKIVLLTWGGKDISITSKNARLLIESKCLQGILKYKLNSDNNTNNNNEVEPDLISSPIIAKEKNIQSVISEDVPQIVSSGNYRNLIKLKVVWEDDTMNTITGSVFGNTPHIVGIDQVYDNFAFKPEGSYLLTFKNEDKPGAVLKVLDLLHAGNVNIANLNVVRARQTETQEREHHAVTLMSLDNDIPSKIMNQIKTLSNLEDVAKIRLV